MRRTQYRQRPYRGPADLQAMQSLTQRLWSSASRWHIGDLAWSRFQHIGREPEWRTSLWECDGQPVAWAWAKPPGHLDLHLDPAHPDLAPEILRWFDEVAPGRSRSVTVLDAETALIGVLRRHGYVEATGGPFSGERRDPRRPARRTRARRRVCARGDDDYPSARATYQAVGFRRYARNVSFVRDTGTL